MVSGYISRRFLLGSVCTALLQVREIHDKAPVASRTKKRWQQCA